MKILAEKIYRKSKKGNRGIVYVGFDFVCPLCNQERPIEFRLKYGNAKELYVTCNNGLHSYQRPEHYKEGEKYHYRLVEKTPLEVLVNRLKNER